MNLLAENLQYLRQSLKLSQSEFGKLFDLTRDNVASYERGAEPRIGTLQKIVNYFHISVDEILTKKLAEKMGSNLGSNLGSNKYKEPDYHPPILTDKPNSMMEQLLDEKDKRIAALNEIINAQKETIESLKKTISALEGDGGDKKKAS